MSVFLPSDVHRAIVFCIKQRVFKRDSEYFKERGCRFFCGSHVSAAVIHNGSILLLSAARADVSLVLQDFLSALRACFCQIGQTASKPPAFACLQRETQKQTGVINEAG